MGFTSKLGWPWGQLAIKLRVADGELTSKTNGFINLAVTCMCGLKQRTDCHVTDKSAKDGCRTYRPQLKSGSVVYGKGSLSQEKAPHTATSSNWMGNQQHRVKTCKSEGLEHLITPLTFQLLLRQVPNHQIIFGNLGLVFPFSEGIGTVGTWHHSDMWLFCFPWKPKRQRSQKLFDFPSVDETHSEVSYL